MDAVSCRPASSKGEKLIRATLTTLAFAGALGLFCYQSAGAIPTDAAVMKRAATAASEVQDAQFYARSHPARRHQVLSAIHRGAACLSPLLSVVVVKPLFNFGR